MAPTLYRIILQLDNLDGLENISRKGAKAQRKPSRNAVALCAFAGKIFKVEL
jgi:hypothetical protein